MKRLSRRLTLRCEQTRVGNRQSNSSTIVSQIIQRLQSGVVMCKGVVDGSKDFGAGCFCSIGFHATGALQKLGFDKALLHDAILCLFDPWHCATCPVQQGPPRSSVKTLPIPSSFCLSNGSR